MKINFRSRTLLSSVFMTILIMILFNQVIFSGKSFGSPDTLSPKSVGIALNNYSDQSGEFPQWKPWIFSGMPSAEAFSHISKLYFPEHLFKLFMLSGMMIQMLHLLFAGIGCFLLLRHFKINYLSSILGSVGFMLTPYMTVMVVHGHGSQMMTAAYIPWIFWFTVKLWQKPNLLDTGVLAILLGFQLQRAHAQIAYYTWMLIGAYSLLIIIKRFREEKNKKHLIHSFGLFSIACLLGIGLCLLIYLQAMDYTPYSIRGGSQTGGADYNYATGWSFHPKEMLTFLIPSAFGFGGQVYWGLMPFTDYPNYMGIIILLLAIIGLFHRRDFIHWFLIITSCLALLISFGKHFSLVYNLFFNIFPYFNKFRVPHMILILLQFNIAILAAFGLESVASIKYKNVPKWFWGLLGFGSIIFLLMVLGGATVEGFIRESFPAPRVQDARTAQIINNIRWSLWETDTWMMIFFIGSLLIVIWLWIQRKISKEIMYGLIVITGIFDICIVNYKIIEPSKSSARASQLISNKAVKRFFEKDEIIQFIKTDKSDFRIYPVGNLFGESRFAAFNIESMGGYHPAKLRSYNNFLTKTRNGSSVPLLRMMNVKYLISQQAINHPDLMLVKSGNLKAPRGSQSVNIYQLSNVLPRAWFVDNVITLEEDKIFKEIINDSFDPSKYAYSSQLVKPPSNKISLINKIEKRLHEINIETESDGNQFLVLSEVFYPKRWKASINGENVETLKVNGVLRGLSIPAGKNNITFRYDKSQFNRGLILSLISFGVTLFLVAFGYYNRNKSR